MARMRIEGDDRVYRVIPVPALLLVLGASGLALALFTWMDFLGGALFGSAVTTWLSLRLVVKLVGSYHEAYLSLTEDPLIEVDIQPAEGEVGFTCPTCGMTSFHPEDERYRYCGNCHKFVDDEALAEGEGNGSDR